MFWKLKGIFEDTSKLGGIFDVISTYDKFTYK